MPNYKLSPRVVEWMIKVGNSLIERRVQHAQAGFPISHDKIQAAILPAKWRAVIMDMNDEGVAALNRAGNVFGAVVGVAGITRPAMLPLFFGSNSRLFLYTDARVAYGDATGFARGSDALALDLSVFDDADMAALTKWVNHAVQERRLANVAKLTLREFLSSGALAPTTGHILARWPALTLLLAMPLSDATSYLSENDKLIWAGWREKFRDPPRSLKPYGWGDSSQWHATHQKAMRLTEIALTSAELMPKEVTDTVDVKAEVALWRPLPTDADKPEIVI